MKLRKILSLLFAAALVLCLAACDADTPETEPVTTEDGTEPVTTEVVTTEPETEHVTTGVGTAYPDKALGFQTEMPAVGDTVACMHTSMGDIYLRFFPEAAPKAVENFTTHAKNGYYDGLTFHRVIKDFMIQGGDPKGNGTGGESIWGSAFEDEFDQKLVNIRGAISMANSGVNTNGSQFFINQGGPDGHTAAEMKEAYDYDTLNKRYHDLYDQYVEYYGASFTMYYPDADTFIEKYVGGINLVSTLVPDEAWELYARVGGNINLDGAFRKKGGHTVFGQVYAGMDVVDAIAAVETGENDKPTTDVTITSIDVFTYEG